MALWQGRRKSNLILNALPRGLSGTPGAERLIPSSACGSKSEKLTPLLKLVSVKSGEPEKRFYSFYAYASCAKPLSDIRHVIVFTRLERSDKNDLLALLK